MRLPPGASRVVPIFSSSAPVASGASWRCVASSRATTSAAATSGGISSQDKSTESTPTGGAAPNAFESGVRSAEEDKQTNLPSSSSSTTTAAAAAATASSCVELDAVMHVDASTAKTKMPSLRRRPRFSFLKHPSDRISCDLSPAHAVPNNTPKPLLPMWASSLTSPQLGKQRLRPENWISTDSMGTLPDEHVVEFLAWLRSRLTNKAYMPFMQQLEENIELHLRSNYARGVIARKAFNAGDVIFAIPLPGALHDGEWCGSSSTAAANITAWGFVLNSETLRRHSLAAQRRSPPSYAEVEAIVTRRKSSFDPVPHVLFVDQVYCALLLACERAEGERSPLYPYLRLLYPFDDDIIRELHLGVLDPPTHLEYNDHCGRFDYYLRRIHGRWTEEFNSFCNMSGARQPFAGRAAVDVCGVDAGNEISPGDKGASSRLPPPSMEDLRWAFRAVLSRQRLLPLRNHVEHFEDVCTEDKRMQREEDVWTRLVTRIRWGIMDRVLGVVDRTRAHVNDFSPHTIATVLPVFDMLQHPPGGIANTEMRIERIPVPAEQSSDDVECDKGGTLCAVARASHAVEEGDELTSLFPRCYSLSYTLYRFGFLPLRRRSDDAAARSRELNNHRPVASSYGWLNLFSSTATKPDRIAGAEKSHSLTQ